MILTRSLIFLFAFFAVTHAVGQVPPRADDSAGYRWTPVSGTGVHYFSTSLVHSIQRTPTGQIVRSTDTVELEGDIHGRILYHPVSVFDFIAATLVNTGNQVFSGTVLGSDPVLLHDDEFRFEVDLMTGETRGWVYLENYLAGEKIRCELEITGPTGMTAAGDPMVDYTGQCRIRTR